MALGAQAVQLKSVTFDDEAALGPDLLDDSLQPLVGNFDRPRATPTDNVVVVLPRRAGDVGVLAGRQVEALQRALLGEQVKGPENPLRGRP